MGRSGVVLAVAAIVTGSGLLAAAMSDLASSARHGAARASCDDRVFPYVQGCPAAPVIATRRDAEPAPAPRMAAVTAAPAPVVPPAPVVVVAAPPIVEAVVVAPPPPVGPPDAIPDTLSSIDVSAPVHAPAPRPVRTARSFEPITSPTKAPDPAAVERREGAGRQVRVIPIDRPEQGKSGVPLVPLPPDAPSNIALPSTPAEAPRGEAAASPLLDPVARSELSGTATASIGVPAAPVASTAEPARSEQAVAVVSGQPASAEVGAPPTTLPVPLPGSAKGNAEFGRRPAATAARDVEDRQTTQNARNRRSRRGYARGEFDERRARREARAERYWSRRREVGDWNYPDAPTRTYRETRRWAYDAPPPRARYYYGRPGDRAGILGFLGGD